MTLLGSPSRRITNGQVEHMYALENEYRVHLQEGLEGMQVDQFSRLITCGDSSVRAPSPPPVGRPQQHGCG